MISPQFTAILVLACVGSIGGCGPRQARTSSIVRPHYVVGLPWESDGYWFYPVQEIAYDATGLAVIDAPRTRARRLTADGEVYDPALLSGAHQTLQLPVILHVRNLENGIEIVLRVNDRGPSSPGRLLSVTPGAARLLRMVPGQAARVHVAEDEALSRELLNQVAGAPPPDIVAAPIDPVREQSLMPGHDVAVTGQVVALRPEQPDGKPAAVAGPARPQATQLWIDAGRFSQPGYARRLAATLAGSVEQDGRGRSASFRVRVGPFELTAEADAALDRARSAGVTGARIIVE